MCELCLYMSHSVSQAQKAFSSLLLSPQYESHIKGSQYVLSRNVFYLYACNLQNTSVIYWITEILMYLKIGTRQRGAIYNLFTNHNSKCIHT